MVKYGNTHPLVEGLVFLNTLKQLARLIVVVIGPCERCGIGVGNHGKEQSGRDLNGRISSE